MGLEETEKKIDCEDENEWNQIEGLSRRRLHQSINPSIHQSTTPSLGFPQ
jgi:hypothetical protein